MNQKIIVAILMFLFTTSVKANPVIKEFNLADANIKTIIDFPLSLAYVITVPANQAYTAKNHICKNSQIDFNPVEVKFHKTECAGYHFYFIWKETAQKGRIHYNLQLYAKNLRSVPTGVSYGNLNSTSIHPINYQYGLAATIPQSLVPKKNIASDFSLDSPVSVFDFYIHY